MRRLAHPESDRVFATDAAITYINRDANVSARMMEAVRALIGVSNVASGPPLTRFFEGRPHKNVTDTIV